MSNVVATAEPLRIKDIIDKSTQFFKQKQIPSPRLDAELLIAACLNLRRIDLYLKFDQPLAEVELEKCRDAIRRRAAGEPVAYILGRREFYGLSFQVNSSVLVPRPETEHLVEEALAWVSRENQPTSFAWRILDLGTGSGCLGLSLLRHLPGATATLVDVSPEALAIAQKNAMELGLAGRCRFLCQDAGLKVEDSPFDIIVMNPPYIASNDSRLEAAVKQFEPGLALFAEQDGLGKIFSWTRAQVGCLKTPGFLGCEFGEGQDIQVHSFFTQLQRFANVRSVKDLAGIQRHMIGEINHGKD